MVDFETPDSPTLISRKIWVTEKFCNLHTVSLDVSRAPLIEFLILTTPLIRLATGEVRPNVRAINYVVSQRIRSSKCSGPTFIAICSQNPWEKSCHNTSFLHRWNNNLWWQKKPTITDGQRTFFSPRFLVFALLLNSAYVPKKLQLATSKCITSTDLGTLIGNIQCGYFRIFLLFRFYVKSIFVIWKPQILPFW